MTPSTALPVTTDASAGSTSVAKRVRARRAPWLALAALTAAVGVAHLLLLGAVPLTGAATPSPVAARFVVRTIEAPALPAPTPPSVTPRPVAAATPREPVPKRPAVPRVRTPTPAAPAIPAVPATASLPAPPIATPAPTSEPPPPVTGAPPDTPVDAVTAEAAPAPADAAVPDPSTPDTPAPAPAPVAPAPSSGPVAETAPLNVPASVRLKFTVIGQQGTVPLQGVFGELAWSQDGRAYEADLTLRFLFKTLRRQHSQGAIGPTGIEPARFSDTRKVEVASHFVRDRGEVVFSNNAPTVALLPGAQDRLSVMLQLGALLAGDPARYPEDGAIAVQTVGPRDADIWLFKVGPEERLTLPMGDVVARRLTRNARQPFDDTVELWLAPALGHLPVRIRLTQPNGDFADMQLREAPPSAAPR